MTDQNLQAVSLPQEFAGCRGRDDFRSCVLGYDRHIQEMLFVAMRQAYVFCVGEIL